MEIFEELFSVIDLPRIECVPCAIKSRWLERMTSETSFGEAVQSAKKSDHGCEPFYSQCPIGTNQLAAFSKETARHYMNYLIQLYNEKQSK